ncbi:hypothetical protein GCK72_022467 [Caenorhabditis remanei]|uniref:Uncharacterized protein n=1 Tax=Caenorhabditis remanei TaxID=31234 RepID=A0A6A5FU30_CAERE|nr:hypothetical protein GCK72_022467 [Caenorhabditis remanei]KAF1746016.1 hypothetical protein GCK72_022467 [Caenorhabditis remanei]
MSTKRLATKSAPAESVANDDDDYPDPPCPKKVSTKAYNPSSWMETQARKAEFPTPAEGEIKVATLFKGFEPLIINVCLDCRTFNSKRDTQEVSPGMVEIQGEIKVATLFRGFDSLIINVCPDCRTFNSKRDTQEVSPGMVEIPLALCLICRSHLVQSRSRKFYDYDVVLLKKKIEDQKN